MINSVDEAENIAGKMEEAQYHVEDLMDHLKGTSLEGWTDTLKALLEDIEALKDEADEIIGEEEEKYREEVNWMWNHR